MNYPQSYHRACAHLVAFGGHAGSTRAGRHKVALALRDLRHTFGRGCAASERRHMLFIAGHFPVKERT